MVTSIEKKTFPANTYIGLKQKVSMAQISDKDIYDRSYKAVMKFMGEHNLIPSGPAAVIYLSWDEATGITEMAPAMPVIGVDTIQSDELSLINLPQSEAMVAHHSGDYATLKDAHQELAQYVKDQNIEMKQSLAVEEYLTNPAAEPDPSKWKTDIWYFIG